MSKVLKQVDAFLTLTVVFLVPLVALPISPNVFVPAKLATLAFGLALVLLVKALRMVVDGKVDLATGNFDLPVLVISVAYVVSTIWGTPNKMEALLLPGTATAVVGGALLYFVINQLGEYKKYLAPVLVGSASVFSVIMMIAATGALSSLNGQFAYLGVRTFSPAGGYLPSAVFLGTMMIVGIGKILSEKDMARKGAYGLAAVVMLFGLGLSAYQLMPGRPQAPRLPSYETSWNIAIGSVNKNPVFGVGPGSYLTAYNRYRPIDVNATDLWNAKFSTSRSFYLTSFTETGLIGLVALAILLLAVYKYAKKSVADHKLVKTNHDIKVNLVALVALLVALLFVPATAMIIVVVFALLSLNSKTKISHFSLVNTQATGAAAKIPAYLLALPLAVLVVLFGMRASNVMAAEYTFKKAIDQLGQNQPVQSYETLQVAINKNPTVDRYHSSYAQVNLALANAIAAQASEETPLTEEQTTQISQLVQQAIREAKNSVALNPLRSGNWAVLGGIYRSVIPLAEGADTFAAQSYAQAIALDPVNPNLRVTLGGLFYGAGNYPTAIRQLELAASAKPDLANAHYNLAFAYRENGDLEQAQNQLTIVLALVEPNTPDYDLAKSALEEIETLIAEGAKPEPTEPEESAEGDELSTPEDQPEDVLDPKLELGDEEEPPEGAVEEEEADAEVEEDNTTEATPTVSPTPTIIP